MGKEVNEFASLHLILEAKFSDGFLQNIYLCIGSLLFDAVRDIALKIVKDLFMEISNHCFQYAESP